MCSGKGVCDWRSDGSAVCNCFDPTDQTIGCYDSPVNRTPNAAPTSMQRLRLNTIVLITLFVLVVMVL